MDALLGGRGWVGGTAADSPIHPMTPPPNRGLFVVLLVGAGTEGVTPERSEVRTRRQPHAAVVTHVCMCGCVHAICQAGGGGLTGQIRQFFTRSELYT